MVSRGLTLRSNAVRIEDVALQRDIPANALAMHALHPKSPRRCLIFDRYLTSEKTVAAGHVHALAEASGECSHTHATFAVAPRPTSRRGADRDAR